MAHSGAIIEVVVTLSLHGNEMTDVAKRQSNLHREKVSLLPVGDDNGSHDPVETRRDLAYFAQIAAQRVAPLAFAGFVPVSKGRREMMRFCSNMVLLDANS